MGFLEVIYSSHTGHSNDKSRMPLPFKSNIIILGITFVFLSFFFFFVLNKRKTEGRNWYFFKSQFWIENQKIRAISVVLFKIISDRCCDYRNFFLKCRRDKNVVFNRRFFKIEITGFLNLKRSRSKHEFVSSFFKIFSRKTWISYFLKDRQDPVLTRLIVMVTRIHQCALTLFTMVFQRSNATSNPEWTILKQSSGRRCQRRDSSR